MNRLIIAASILALSVSTAFAGFQVKDYDKIKKLDTFNWYLQGFGDAFMAANVDLESKGIAPLYCPPENLTLTPENYKNILETSIDSLRKLGVLKDFDDMTLLLKSGLISTFPCNLK